MTKRAPSLSCRLTRSRRTLATILLLGGAAMSGLTEPATAHDHVVPTIDRVQAMAERLPQQPGDLTAPIATWTFDDWLAETYGVRPTAERISKASTGGNSSDRLTGSNVADSTEIGVPSRRKGDAVGSLFSTAWIQNWLPWGSAAKQWISPLLPTLTSSEASPGVPLASNRSLARDLADLTCEEPIDINVAASQLSDLDVVTNGRGELAVVETQAGSVDLAAESQDAVEPSEISAPSEPPATEPPKFAQLALVGSSPIIVTLPDGYLSYDLSPEDVIAMRMYPIDQPAPYYSTARRTSVYGPVAALDNSAWRIVSEPAITVSTAELARSAVSSVSLPTDIQEAVTETDSSVADQRLAEVLHQIVQAVQPDSELRHHLRPEQLGTLLGRWSQQSGTLADSLLANLITLPGNNSASNLGEPSPQVAQAELLAPRQLAEHSAPLLPTGEGRVLQVELACQAALDVVMAQAARSAPVDTAPASAEPTSDPVTRALAVATACDHAAASLEKLAMAIRRAGDSLVRQAQAGAGNGSLLR